MKEDLKFIFNNVNEWLKFAELKHSGLIVFNGAVIVGIISAYSTLITLVNETVLKLTLTVLFLSILLSLISQFPKISNIFSTYKIINAPNILFFGHLKNLDNNKFIEEFKKSNNEELSTLDINIINQILINSRIANNKYQLFKLSSILTTVSILILIIFAIIKIWL